MKKIIIYILYLLINIMLFGCSPIAPSLQISSAPSIEPTTDYVNPNNLYGQEVRESSILYEIDPFGFLDEPQLIGSDINMIIGDMVLDQDYEREEHIIELEEFKEDSFVTYRFYPLFDYMNAGEEFTYIEMNTPYNSDIIDVFSYNFLWEYDNIDTLLSSVEKQYNNLTSSFGNHSSCSYTSLTLDGSGVQDITYEELCRHISNQNEGMYHIQWENQYNTITLGITIDFQYKYIEGAVFFRIN